jgi:hypothetical protein
MSFVGSMHAPAQQERPKVHTGVHMELLLEVLALLEWVVEVTLDEEAELAIEVELAVVELAVVELAVVALAVVELAMDVALEPAAVEAPVVAVELTPVVLAVPETPVLISPLLVPPVLFLVTELAPLSRLDPPSGPSVTKEPPPQATTARRASGPKSVLMPAVYPTGARWPVGPRSPRRAGVTGREGSGARRRRRRGSREPPWLATR